MTGDWADTIADEMIAKANMQPERLEVLRHEVAGALRAEREACAKIAEAHMTEMGGDVWLATMIAIRIRTQNVERR